MNSQATSMTIGGAVRRSQLVAFARACWLDNVRIGDWDGPIVKNERTLLDNQPTESLELYNDDTRGGVLHAIERACQDIGLTYVRQTDLAYAWWAPGLDRVMTCDHVCGEPVVRVAELRAVMDRVRPASGIRKLIENATPVNVPVFRIVED